jgi:[ribosomal protein S18]-alanine N-acetyltransferase
MWVRSMTLGDCEALEAQPGGATLGVEARAELSRELTRAWVAGEAPEGPALACVLAWWVVDELQIMALETLPMARRRGVARALLTEVIAAATAAGARRVSLEVAEHNEAAVRLYSSLGFRVFNVRRAYYRQTGENALEMELGLPAAEPLGG